MDFRFGAGAGGNRERLADFSREFGFDVEFVPDELVDGQRVSSTRIRTLIGGGRVAEAARCLGRPYNYVGEVVEGHHVGGRLGFPTANVAAPRFLTPAEGVYAGWAHLHGRRVAAAISVGRAPTFYKNHPVVVEAFLLDFEGELYGEQVSLDFIDFVRTQRAFSDPSALRAQMAADCDRVRAVLGGATA
jgi:riboflavin kinase / FMN adenylyltransferase